MGYYESDRPDVAEMKGLHLFHFMLSNCSQRVRLALEEKGLAWTSHHMNLPANEHLDPEYLRLNPNGVVPTLVDDGQVVLESNHILDHLEQRFPEPALVPADGAARERMARCMERASEAQGAIKVLSHELLFRPFRPMGEAEVRLFEEKHPDASLQAFVRDYAENGGAWKARVDAAQDEMTGFLDGLEAILEASPWLSGDAFGLADISWIVNAHRLHQASYPLERWPKLRAWYEKAAARPAFDRAIASYRPS